MPLPRVERKADGTLTVIEHLPEDAPACAGRIKAFHGQFALLVRALAYILALGGEGLKTMAGDAVLNANYMLARLAKGGATPAYPEKHCMHEFVLSDESLVGTGVTTMDLSKHLLDCGLHAPTNYFPLCVSGAFLVEPTESEPLERLNEFCDIVIEAIAAAKEGPEASRHLHEAPSHLPLRRIDEAAAARKPVLFCECANTAHGHKV
eukprot:gnl/Ergobibamus_cyprinoides/1903.p2 GENE.gnl/Ergobibamus_cyprinoides/1903~~gnl/Ergobibamus_cyprinoides/1903.p2  ORF type:complete len:207 (+),score=94.56 gnl/Ergobibamus_cyprinoides/1903:478-1098(+)